MDEEIKKLNRFTSIPFLLDMLSREKLTLLNPGFWEDYNDRETVEAYRIRSGAKSIYAMCFTFGSETIHHWNAFANGTSGCSIEFSPEKLLGKVESLGNADHGKVEYISLKKLSDFDTAQLPYVKRQPYAPEKEYRIIVKSDDEQKIAYDIPIDIGSIRRITINSKIPKSVFDSLRKIIRDINPNFKGKISHSTLFKNETWIGHFTKK